MYWRWNRNHFYSSVLMLRDAHAARDRYTQLVSYYKPALFHVFVWSKDYLVCHYVWPLHMSILVRYTWYTCIIMSCLMSDQWQNKVYYAQTNLQNIYIVHVHVQYIYYFQFCVHLVTAPPPMPKCTTIIMIFMFTLNVYVYSAVFTCNIFVCVCVCVF